MDKKRHTKEEKDLVREGIMEIITDGNQELMHSGGGGRLGDRIGCLIHFK